MSIHGAEQLTGHQLLDMLENGGRVVSFSYCVSVLILTFKRSTDLYLVRPGESAFVKSLPWTLLTLALGWWGFPFGLLFTPWALFENLAGGQDHTAAVLADLRGYAPGPPAGY